MPAPHHLVTVWNPAYAADPLEAHVHQLCLYAAALRAGDPRVGADDVCVYWGQVRSPNRQQPYPHGADLEALAREFAPDGAPPRELHLYLTDYRSLYVAHVDALLRGADVDAEEQGDFAPPYYAERELKVDWWFRLRDVRRLVHHDLEAVIAHLKALRNVHYGDRPVSLYGGMVDLPLVVTRDDGTTWFDRAERDAVTGGRLWAEHDRDASGTGAMHRALRDDLLGPEAWEALAPKTQLFLATAEDVFRRYRTDGRFDFQAAMTCHAKALEVQTNAVLRTVLAAAPDAARLAKVGDRTVDLRAHGALTLGQLAVVLEEERALRDHCRLRLRHGEWFVTSLPAVLAEFTRAVRNDGTHAEPVPRELATTWRAQFMGIGCVGVFVELARVRPV